MSDRAGITGFVVRRNWGTGEPKLAQMAAYSGLLAARAAAERSVADG